MMNANPEFELGGVHHCALVCRDMARTVDFYTDVLGMPLVKTLELPHGMGQHFFFDVGNGDTVAFFWFPDAPEPVPGITAPGSFPIVGDLRSAISSMNHLALSVPPQKFDEYVAKLVEKGIATSEVANHDDSEWQISRRNHEGVFLRSVYFFDPDGILLEFACWTRPLSAADVNLVPATTTTPSTR